MKTIITLLLIVCSALFLNAQSQLADFENFSLPGNSYYTDTNSTPFVTAGASFEYKWTKGSFAYWSGGFSYTNVYDSTTAGFNNLYGVRPYKGVNASAKFVVAQDHGTIRLQNPGTYLQGFYYTNTTYAYKAMRDGDMFCRKFGDTTGVGTPTMAQGTYPDYFKVVIKAFKNGILKNDSLQFYLADFTGNSAQDYIVSDWRYINTASLGIVDSVRFFMRSTDVGAFGMNTPAFFAIDDLTTTTNPLSLSETMESAEWSVHPNPFSDKITIGGLSIKNDLQVKDLEGRNVMKVIPAADGSIDLSSLKPGVYFLQIDSNSARETKKIVKL